MSYSINEMLDLTRIAVCLAFLIYASWSDYKTREVSNMVWVVFAPAALALTVVQFFISAQESQYTYILSFAVTSILSLVLFYAGAFGGADAKALICLSIALPTYPLNFLQQSWFISPLFPITVFTNGVLLAALSVIYALFRNFLWKSKTKKRLFEGLEEESLGRKIVALLTGYKTKISTLKEREHLYPLEDVYVNEKGENRRKLLVFPKDEEREDIVARLLKAADEEELENEVLATPGLPLLIFITAGLIVGLAYGDIVWAILSSILK